jgi:hypothetical protein
MKVAGLDWTTTFAPGCDDAVFTATDGVPRLVNQLCDHALMLRGDSTRPVSPNDVAAAWRDIQRLPAPAAADDAAMERAATIEFGGDAAAALEPFDHEPGGMQVLEFGSLDHAGADGDGGLPMAAVGSPEASDPWSGPEVELVFDGSGDPFAEYFEQERAAVERFRMRGPDDFRDCRHVVSREGESLGRQLAACERIELPALAAGCAAGREAPDPVGPAASAEPDDTDMVVIEEDLADQPESGRPAVVAVRPGDYRSLFARLRRGDGAGQTRA